MNSSTDLGLPGTDSIEKKKIVSVSEIPFDFTTRWEVRYLPSEQETAATPKTSNWQQYGAPLAQTFSPPRVSRTEGAAAARAAVVRRAKNCIFGGLVLGWWDIRFWRVLEKVMLVDGVDVDGDENGSEMACGFIYVVVVCSSS